MENKQKKSTYIINGKKVQLTEQEYITTIATQILKDNITAFKELSK